jgi:hypothetical protein
MLLAVISLLALCKSQARAAIYYVSSSGSGNGSSWANAGPLQTVVNAAQSGDQIWVEAGIYVGNFTAKDGVAVYGGFAGTETKLSQRNVTANPTYLDANGSGTVYTIPSAAVATNTIDGFTVENGTSRGLNDPSGDKLVIANCTFTGNSVTSLNGGGLYALCATLTITNTTFSSNSADGANYAYLTVYGGGIYTGSNTTTTISSSFFSGNTANAGAYDNAYGGAIYCTGPTTITNTTFSSNGASNFGGGVDASGKSIAISGSTFSSNSNCAVVADCTTNTITNCGFTDNTGRAITVTGPDTSTVSDCDFTGNSMLNANGGAVYSSSLITTITGCNFDNNQANGANYAYVTLYGGGVYTEAGTTATVTDCSFVGNATTSGAYDNNRGGGYCGEGTPTVERCIFSNNTPDDIELEDTGTLSAPAYIKDCLITESGSDLNNWNGIDLGIQETSTTFVYAVVANNTIVGTFAGINIGTGSYVGGAVSVANNVFYGNYGGLNYDAGATFVSSHNDIDGNSHYGYYGVAPSSTDVSVAPGFVDAATADYQLAAGSPLIDAGNDSYVAYGDLDLIGNPRILGAAVDIGCYEAGVASASGVLTSLTPASAQAGHLAFTLTAKGTGFASGAVLNWSGAKLVTTVVSSTELTASVPAALATTAGTASITETNPYAVPSNALTFTVTAPATLTGISPTPVYVGGPQFTLTATGTNFIKGAVIRWNATKLTTTFVSATKLTAVVPASDIASTGTVNISVANPAVTPTAPLPLTIVNQPATIAALTPSSVVAGSPTFVLVVAGTNLVAGSVVNWNGSALTSAYLSPNFVVALVPATLIASPATTQITVTNPGTTASNSLPITITPSS